ncbi:NAD(P)-dependent oxidoreductase [Liquorilactobacillus vini]|uniref:NAD(P)-dependent oxidoreductase n=1 Tax=Liquorilactobacillus vini TaxID=238015 RepID=UPI00030BAFF5|nr:NAD(P)-dependent oxidoreductase [Liquorilactobacillus vini]
MPKIEEILALADFVVILLPLTDQTRHFLTNRHFKLMKKTAFLLNFGRNQIVDNQALLTALANNEFAGYITDFPKTELQNQPKITLLPHLGGNTAEALTSSTNLALQSLLNFLASGTIQQAVNFPAVDLPFDSPQRITLYFANHQTLWNAITQTLSSYGLPINEMAGNTTKEGYSYSLINTDLSACNLQQILQLPTDLAKIPGMIRVRLLDSPANIIQTSN